MANSTKKAKQALLFSFGVISDTHVRAPEGDLSSPYPVNEKANDRARYACELLAAQEPAFVVHLGDMVHPLPAMDSYDAACNEAIELFQPLMPELHFVSGNHDVGDKPMPGSPAAIVNDRAIVKYSQWFGKHWYSFDHQAIRIVVINSSLINSDTDAEREQQAWLLGLLAQSNDYRIVLFSHYPVFLHDINEAEHYDNIAQPGRGALLTAIEQHSVELVLSGHVHHFFYNRSNDTDFFVLPSTCFTRQDYADLFKASPAPEYGRDDAAKLGVTMIDVFSDGFSLRHLATNGKSLLKNESTQHDQLATAKHSASVAKSLAVSMRHPWHESIDLPYNGPMEEFTRKRARNDYSLLRLMQMGISNLRVPLQDFIDQPSRQRLADYAALGFTYQVICPQILSDQIGSAIGDMEYTIASIEYVLPNDKEHWQFPTIEHMKNVPMNISYAASGAHSANSGKPFAHSVSAGFEISAIDNVMQWLQKHDATHNINGVMVQIPWESKLDLAIDKIENSFGNTPYRCVINLRIAPSSPADENIDDHRITERIHCALNFCDSSDNLNLQLDTFMSIDRGYSPRRGLIDRLGNLTPAGASLLQTSPPNPTLSLV